MRNPVFRRRNFAGCSPPTLRRYSGSCGSARASKTSARTIPDSLITCFIRGIGGPFAVADSILKWFIPYVLLSSFNYPIAKDGLNYASPFLFMAMRYLLAAAILLAIGRRLILRRQPVILGLVTSASSFFWILGLSVVSAGDSAVLSYTMPLFAIPLAVLLLKERPIAVEVAGALVGFAGVAIYSLALAHGSLLIGVTYTLLNAFFWAVYSVYL